MITLKNPIYFIFEGRAISKDNEKIVNRYGRHYLSTRFKIYEKDLKESARKQYNGPLLLGNLSISLTFRFKNNVHPDLTNLPKSVCDAMNKVVWKDDRQIRMCFLSLEIGEDEKVLLQVSEFEDR